MTMGVATANSILMVTFANDQRVSYSSNTGPSARYPTTSLIKT